MGDIRISPPLQLLLVLSVVGAVIAAIVAQMPEIQRYLKVKQM